MEELFYRLAGLKPLHICLIVIVGIIVFLLAALIQIFIHETGHLVFGIITKHKFVYFKLFLFVIMNIQGKLRIKKSQSKEPIGQCVMVPKNSDCYKLCTMGGILANVIVSFLSLYLFFLTGNYLLRYLFLCILVIGLITALANGYPSREQINDGYVYRAARKSEYTRQNRYCQLLVTKALMGGMSYRDMPEEWFDADEGALPEPLAAYHMLLKYYRALDTENIQKAHKCIMTLKEHLQSFPEEIQNDVYMEDFYLQIIDGEQANQKDKYNKPDEEYIRKEPCLETFSYDTNLARIYLAYELFAGYLNDMEIQAECREIAKDSILAGEIKFMQNQIDGLVKRDTPKKGCSLFSSVHLSYYQ